MNDLFSTVLNMSMTGSVVILLVMLARLILKRSPKIFSYALWSVVLFRLLCPVAFTAPVSVLNALEPEVQEASDSTSVVSFIPAQVNQNAAFAFVPAENQSGTEFVQAGKTEHNGLDFMTISSYAWIAGTTIMILYSMIQYIRLRGKLVGAMGYGGDIFLADYIDTPFVMGILQPKIYLPSTVPTKERKYIIAHERHHVRRLDHMIKLLAYLALCIHWFNPLAWAAFILAGKDMEMSCDEAVIRKMGSQIRADYSASLLRLATHKKIIAGMPLAFGEGDTKGRVMNMAKWKKPKLWVSLICLLLCTTILVACAVNPQNKNELTHSGEIIIGNLRLPLPDGYTYQDNEDGSISIAYQGNMVAGIVQRAKPEISIDRGSVEGGKYTGNNFEEWVVALGLPEAQEDAPYTGMIGDTNYGDLEAEYFDGTNPDQYDVIHYFYIHDTVVYDVWCDLNLLPNREVHPIMGHIELLEDEATHTTGGMNTTKITGMITCDNRLNIRKEPTISSAIVGYYSNGTVITILETKDGWGRTDEGWISMDFVTTIDSTTIVDSAELVPVSNKLNIRKEPDALSAVVGQYSNGTTITILETKDGWGRTDEGWIYMDYVTITDGSTGIITTRNAEIEAYMPTIPGSDIVTDTQLVQYGALKMLLPSGFSAHEQNGAIVLRKDSVDVGGITCWNHPGFEPDDMIEWMKALGIPELQEDFEVPIGYMAGGSTNGDLEIEIFWDGNPDALNEEHEFFIDGDIVYDVWFDQNLISDGIAERFLKTVAINAEPAVEENPDEKAAFEKCRAVIEAVQSGSCQIVIEQPSISDPKSQWSTTNYYQDNGNWLKIKDVDPEAENIVDGEQYSIRIAFMVVNGVRYSNEGKWGKAYTDIEWREDNETFNDSVKPWLASFQWDDAVAYVDTLTDKNGERVMLRVDEKYKDSDEYDPHYFVNFHFDSDGNFVDAQLQVNLFRENELLLTESIVSMDPEVVNSEIQKEYQHAIG